MLKVKFCGFYNPEFIIYSSLGSFYIPCLVMVVLYSSIFKVVKNLTVSLISISDSIITIRAPAGANKETLKKERKEKSGQALHKRAEKRNTPRAACPPVTAPHKVSKSHTILKNTKI